MTVAGCETSLLWFQVWSVSSLWIVPIVGWHHFVNEGRRVVPPDVCDTEYATNTALKIVTSILNFYLPLAIMYALYSKIFVEVGLFNAWSPNELSLIHI